MVEDPGGESALPGEPGVRFAPDGVLVRQALDLLARGPCRAGDLASDVLGIRGGPPEIADRLVTQMLEGLPEVVRDPDGAWRLARRGARAAGGADRDAVGAGPETERGAPDPVPAARSLGELRYAVVDVETTGGIAGRGGRMVEIAIVHVDGGEIGDCYSSLIDAGVSIPPWIARLTGIRTEMIRGAPRFSEICDEVRARLGGRVFVAHNVGFDWGFVRAEMQMAGAAIPRGPRLCTVHMARRLLPGLERRGLDSVARYYGIEIQGRHRARGDAVATAQVLTRMLADAERRGWTTWRALLEALAEKPPRRKRSLRDEIDRAGR